MTKEQINEQPRSVSCVQHTLAFRPTKYTMPNLNELNLNYTNRTWLNSCDPTNEKWNTSEDTFIQKLKLKRSSGILMSKNDILLIRVRGHLNCNCTSISCCGRRCVSWTNRYETAEIQYSTQIALLELFVLSSSTTDNHDKHILTHSLAFSISCLLSYCHSPSFDFSNPVRTVLFPIMNKQTQFFGRKTNFVTKSLCTQFAQMTKRNDKKPKPNMVYTYIYQTGYLFSVQLLLSNSTHEIS